MGTSGLDILSHVDEGDERFAYHPLVKERLQQMLDKYASALETTSPTDVSAIAKAQEGKSALGIILRLPEKIQAEEREKRKKR